MPKGDGVGRGVQPDTNVLKVCRVVDGVSAPLVVSARVPTSLGDPMDSPRDGAVGVRLQRFGAGGPVDFDPGFAEDGAGVAGGLSEEVSPIFDCLGNDSDDRVVFGANFEGVRVGGWELFFVEKLQKKI